MNKINYSIIVAIAQNSVIGNKGTLPWRSKADMKNFKKITTGHTVVMGRKTWESLKSPLANRYNIIMSNHFIINSIPMNCSIAKNIEEVKSLAHRGLSNEAFIIGGSSIYNAFLPYVTKLYITKLDCHPIGDTFWEPNLSNWHLVSSSPLQYEDGDDCNANFNIYELDARA